MDKPIKTILTSKDGKPAVRYSPVVKLENVGEHLNNLLDAFPIAIINILQMFPMMRPPLDKERQANIYVFQDGDEGVKENNVYKIRKEFYERLTALFSVILSTGFPDIEYIERCSKFQEQYALDHTDEEHAEYLEEVKRITEYVREHYKEIIADEVVEETKSVAE